MDTVVQTGDRDALIEKLALAERRIAVLEDDVRRLRAVAELGRQALAERERLLDRLAELEAVSQARLCSPSPPWRWPSWAWSEPENRRR